MHGWTRHAGSKYWLGVWKLLANSAVSRNKTNGGRYVLERFVFPARSEEWVAVAEVRVAKRFYSHRLELVAQLEQTGPTHYLKVKPSLRGRADAHIIKTSNGGAAPAREGCAPEVAASMSHVPALITTRIGWLRRRGGLVRCVCHKPSAAVRSTRFLCVSEVPSRLRLAPWLAHFLATRIETARGALPVRLLHALNSLPRAIAANSAAARHGCSAQHITGYLPQHRSQFSTACGSPCRRPPRTPRAKLPRPVARRPRRASSA